MLSVSESSSFIGLKYLEAIGSIALSHDKKCVIASCCDNKLKMIAREDGEVLNE